MKTITESQLQMSALLRSLLSLEYSRHDKGWTVLVVLKNLEEKAVLVTQRNQPRVWKSLDRAIKHVSKFYAPASDYHIELRL